MKVTPGTQAEVDDMLSHEMEMMTPDALRDELDRLGYKIRKCETFNYANSSNKNSYHAKSVSIEEQDSGIGFSNIAARRDGNFRALQQLRFNTFVLSRGRIWEL